MRVFETSLPKRIARCSVVRSQPVRARTAQVRNLTQGAPRAPPPCSKRHVVAHSGHVEDFVLSTLNTDEELEREKTWVRTQITTWLDEEWTPLPAHAVVGAATAEAYCRLRAKGENEVGSILLGLGAELLSVNFYDTFTSAFEVSNKVIELVMLRSGCDVCCTSTETKERLQRVSDSLDGSVSS